ncbi:cobalamin biosynthesis protein CobW [Mycolicibacterium parafortuitum]|uniref:Cobalamin biosynthesis protein CobW n=1 Tax=Mycolicibacterium parafortuitum TaxID=39692 RepID=A0A7I7TZX9_MYCPF|nr:GTP-binding protein [Mycolicibacterium parafortuitum]PQD97980.1 cobalamin biosynthesis protein CobW [Mycobacterium sp. EPG1]BBY74722.1 cobalamin biosynthesis protein CobW [Mycolicibacterium parafortuitum]
MQPIPVIALTGYLGAGKTTLLNHVLRSPNARIGVVINDFGELNVDAGLVTGQVDEPASIAGGCICCLPDEGGLDVALERLADPKLRLDAIIVESSGLADPVAVSRIIRFSGVDGVRPGGVVDVLDAATHFDTVDRDATPPARYGAATLVVVNKLDQVPAAGRAEALGRIESRVHEVNPHAHVVGATAGRIDPALLYDIAAAEPESGQLSFRELFFDAEPHEHDHDHVHADSVTVRSDGCVDPAAVLDVLDDPPPGAYRMKGTIAVRYRSTTRRYTVNVVGPTVHVADAPARAEANSLVAIGMGLDTAAVRDRLRAALTPVTGTTAAQGIRRLQRYRKLSI